MENSRGRQEALKKVFFNDATRKPCEWNKVATASKEKYQDLINGLQIISAEEEVYHNDNPQVLDEFGEEMRNWFCMVNKRGELFMVATEGYGYARYILKLK